MNDYLSNFINNIVGFIKLILIIIALIFLFYIIVAIHDFLFPKPKYRIRLIDPVTSQIKYVLSVDGINKTCKYTASSENALITGNLPRAERILATMPNHTNAIIEVKHRSYWTEFTTEG